MDQAMSAIDLIERILRLGQAARDRYHEYREDHRPPGLVEAWKTDQEINKGNRKLLQKLMTAYRGNDVRTFHEHLCRCDDPQDFLSFVTYQSIKSNDSRVNEVRKLVQKWVRHYG